MDLELHKSKLQSARDKLRESNTRHDVALYEHWYNPVHPDRWRALGSNVRAFGHYAFELIRLVPHVSEIRKLNKEKDN